MVAIFFEGADSARAGLSVLPIFEGIPPLAPASDVWIEGENASTSNCGAVQASTNCYNGQEWTLYTTNAPSGSGYYVQYSNITVPVSGYYQLRVAGQPIGSNWTSPVYLTVDGGTPIHITTTAASIASWGISSSLRWTDLALVNLTAGVSHTLTITIKETRPSGGYYAYAIDALVLVQAGKTLSVFADNDTIDTNSNNLAVVSDVTNSVSYSVRNESTNISSGTLPMAGGSAILPLTHGVGWYEADLNNGTTSVTNSFSVLRSPSAPLTNSLVSSDAALAWLNVDVTNPHFMADFRSEVSGIMGLTGLGWSRDRLDWNEINSSTNVYNWTNYDQSVSDQTNQGIHVLNMFQSCPTYLKDPNNPNSPFPPASLWESYKWGYELASHYASLDTNQVQAYEYFNEPDLNAGMPLEQLVPHMLAFYNGVKDAHPSAIVLSSPFSYENLNTPKLTQWFKMLRSLGYDVFSYHWYPGTNGADGVTNLTTQFPIDNATVAALNTDHSQWVTESGYQGLVNATNGYELSSADEISQADYMSKLQALGPVLGLGRLFSFVFPFYHDDNPIQWGMLRGNACNPRPAVSAMAASADLLNGVVYKGSFSFNSSTLTGYIYTNSSTNMPGSSSPYMMAVWGSPRQYTLPSGVTLAAVRDYLGRTTTNSGNSFGLQSTAQYLLFANNSITNYITPPPAPPTINITSPSHVVMCWHLPSTATVDKANEQYTVATNTSTAVTLEIVNLSTSVTVTDTIDVRLSNPRWTLNGPTNLNVILQTAPTNVENTPLSNSVVFNFHLTSPTNLDQVQLEANPHDSSHDVRATQFVGTTTGSRPTVGTNVDGGILIDATVPTQNVLGFAHTFSWQAGSEGSTNYMAALPTSTNSFSASQVVRAPEINYLVNFPNATNYYVWVDEQTSGGTNGVHLGLDEVVGAKAQSMNTTSTNWGWVRVSNVSQAYLTIPTAGVHTVDVWPKYYGTEVKQIFLSTNANPTLPSP